MTRAARDVAATVGLVAGGHVLPSVVTIPAVHKRWLPRLSGISSRPHVALTFDDGPDAVSTPAFLDQLAGLRVHATFFLLGTQLVTNPDVAARVIAAGHEIGVHGWTHRPHLLRTPWDVETDLRRALDRVRDTTGVLPRYWRPPNGIVTGAGLRAARRLGLTPVLWTADGRDWARTATGHTVATRVLAHLDAGGTVLLHDSDVTSAPGSWRSALAALPDIVEQCRRRDWAVGPLRDHWDVPAGTTKVASSQ